VPPPAAPGEAESPTNPLLAMNRKSLARAAHQILEEIIGPGEKAEEPEPEPEPIRTASRSHLLVTRSKGVSLVHLVPKAIVAESDIRNITDELGELIDSGQNCIALNFKNVERLSSQVMGEVVQVYRRCKDKGGTLKICTVPPQVAQILSMTKIDRHIEVFPDERLALASAWPEQAPDARPPTAAEKGTDEREPSHAPFQTVPQRRVRLILEVGKAKGRVVEVGVPRFLIGRDQRCHLRPNSNAISRLHAAIDQREGRVFIRDFGSASGTILSGRKLHDEEAEAFDGDRLQIDVLLFTISIADQVGRPAPQALDESLHLLFGGQATDPHADTMIMKVMDLTNPAAGTPTPVPPASPTPPHAPSRPEEPAKKHHHLKCEVVRDVAVVTILTPDLSDDFDISSVRIELESLLEQTPHHRMILSLEHVTAMSRGCVIMLLARVQHYSHAKGVMRLCRVSPPLKEFLEKTQLPLLVDIFPTLEEAMETPWE
jgi:anti-anti-sigma factor